MSADSQQDLKLWRQAFSYAGGFRNRTHGRTSSPEANAKGNALLNLAHLYYQEYLFTSNKKTKQNTKQKAIHILEEVIQLGYTSFLIRQARDMLELSYGIKVSDEFLISGRK